MQAVEQLYFPRVIRLLEIATQQASAILRVTDGSFHLAVYSPHLGELESFVLPVQYTDDGQETLEECEFCVDNVLNAIAEEVRKAQTCKAALEKLSTEEKTALGIK